MNNHSYFTKSKVSGVKCRFLFTLLFLLIISAGSSKAYADEVPPSVTIDHLIYKVIDKTDHYASVRAESQSVDGDIEIKKTVKIDGTVYAVTKIEA